MLQSCAGGDAVWSEWEVTGTRRDDSVHQMARVIVFGVRGGQFSWARFYLELVQAAGGELNDAIPA